jgi:hypothetical protein
MGLAGPFFAGYVVGVKTGIQALETRDAAFGYAHRGMVLHKAQRS